MKHYVNVNGNAYFMAHRFQIDNSPKNYLNEKSKSKVQTINQIEKKLYKYLRPAMNVCCN